MSLIYECERGWTKRMNNLIINLAPTGMIPTKSLTPFVPITPEEIVTDVKKCIELGASMIHLHARDSEGVPTHDKKIYADIIRKIKEFDRNVIIIVSTSGRNYPEFSKRSEVLELDGEIKPDMASLTLGSLNFIKTASANSPEMIVKLLDKMNNNNIKPELEVFDLGMVNFSKHLIKKGLLKPPYYFNILLGNIATAQAKLSHLALIVSELPETSIYSIGGLGRFQKRMNALGVIEADGVRVGIEDNIWFDENQNKLATNELLLSRVKKMAESIDRPIAKPIEVREILRLY